jgi:uncharacterized protein YydD (DUF2326 family)
MHTLKQLSPTRDYNRATNLSIEFYDKAVIDILPTPVRKLLEHIQITSNAAAAETKNKIHSELARVKGFLEVQNKKTEIKTRLAQALLENENMKVITTKCDELMQSELKGVSDDDDDADSE